MARIGARQAGKRAFGPGAPAQDERPDEDDEVEFGIALTKVAGAREVKDHRVGQRELEFLEPCGRIVSSHGSRG